MCTALFVWVAISSKSSRFKSRRQSVYIRIRRNLELTKRSKRTEVKFHFTQKLLAEVIIQLENGKGKIKPEVTVQTATLTNWARVKYKRCKIQVKILQRTNSHSDGESKIR